MTAGKRITWSILRAIGGVPLPFQCTTDSSFCAKVFVKEKDTVGFPKNSDPYGGRFIVEGNHIRDEA